jgi:hypothetical protein
MNHELYHLYKKRYFRLLKAFEHRSNAQDIMLELTHIELDDAHRKIKYKGKNIDKITPYFPKSVLTNN